MSSSSGGSGSAALSSSLVVVTKEKKVKVSKAVSCAPCRASKLKCEKIFPCPRCVRLGYECEDPQIEAQAAAAAAAALDGEPLSELPSAPGSCSSSSSSRASDGSWPPHQPQQLRLLPPRSPSGGHQHQHQPKQKQQLHLAASSDPAGAAAAAAATKGGGSSGKKHARNHARRQQKQQQQQPPQQQQPQGPPSPSPHGANGAGDTIHERMHSGMEVDLSQPRQPPMMETSMPVCKEKTMCFLMSMALVHQRRGAQHRVVQHIIRTIAAALGMELGALPPLIQSTVPGPMNFQCFVHGCLENAVHPFCKAFYTDAFATFSWVTIGGDDRIYINRPFAELFESEEALNEELAGGDSSPRAMVLRGFHPADRDEVDRLLDYCFFISGEECSEAVHVLRCQSPKTGRSFMALVRFRSATWHKGWYYCGTLSIQPLPLPISLFAARDRWWHLARAPESGRLSSTGALLQHGDAFFLDPTARRLVATQQPQPPQQGGPGRKRARLHQQPPLGGLQQPQTLHGLMMGGGGGGIESGNSVASSLSALELYGEPLMLEADGGGGAGSGSGSGSGSDNGEEEGPEVYVPAQWDAGADWPRFETTTQPPRQQHRPPLALPAPPSASSVASSASSSSAGPAPAALMASAIWPPAAAGAMLLSSFPPQPQQQQQQPPLQSGAMVPVKTQQGMGEEKEHAPDAAGASALAAAAAAAAALAGPPSVGRGGMAVVASSPMAPMPMSQQGMAPGVRGPLGGGGGGGVPYQPAAQPPTVSTYYQYHKHQHQQQVYQHQHQHQQRMPAAAAVPAVADGGDRGGGVVAGGPGKPMVAGYAFDGSDGGVAAGTVPAAGGGSPRGGFGGGDEGGLVVDDGLLDLLCESPLLFDAGGPAAGAQHQPPAAQQHQHQQHQHQQHQQHHHNLHQVQPAAQYHNYHQQHHQQQRHHYQQPAPPASMGGYAQAAPRAGAAVGTWGPSA